jgi:acetyl-CoA synthetase
MRPSVIRKDLGALRPTPHLLDLERECASFSWAQARAQLEGLAGGALNIAHEAVERHARGTRAQQVALRWLGAGGDAIDFTYGDLSALSNRFANALTKLGIARGDVLFVLAPRIPELYVAVLGALKAGVVVSPLFSAFGPEPIATRIRLGRGRALLTTRALYERKVAPIRAQLGSLQTVLVAGEHAGEPSPEGTLGLDALLDAASERFDTVATRPDELALLHFTSGTTGKPKGAMHVHEAVVAHYATGRYALDLHDGDVFWCTADPGWVTGMSYGVIAPLVHGVTMIVDEAEFDAERCTASCATSA